MNSAGAGGGVVSRRSFARDSSPRRQIRGWIRGTVRLPVTLKPIKSRSSCRPLPPSLPPFLVNPPLRLLPIFLSLSEGFALSLLYILYIPPSLPASLPSPLLSLQPRFSLVFTGFLFVSLLFPAVATADCPTCGVRHNFFAMPDNRSVVRKCFPSTVSRALFAVSLSFSLCPRDSYSVTPSSFVTRLSSVSMSTFSGPHGLFYRCPMSPLKRNFDRLVCR